MKAGKHEKNAIMTERMRLQTGKKESNTAMRRQHPDLTGFSSGEQILLVDLISKGASNRPYPLSRRKSEAARVSLFFPLALCALNHPYPRALCTLPSVACIKIPRWGLDEINDQHLQSHGKITDCEKSIRNMENMFSFPF